MTTCLQPRNAVSLSNSRWAKAVPPRPNYRTNGSLLESRPGPLLPIAEIFEKLRRVELLNDTLRTAPDHSRPATCVVDADIDTEDQPERDPQQGH